MRIIVEISEQDAPDIRRAIALANLSKSNTHGPLTVESLAEMLLQDVALAVRRPGCWEASNMSAVLASHGYQI